MYVEKHYLVYMPADEGTKYEEFRYPGGEVQVRILDSEHETIKEADILTIVAAITDGDIMPLAMLTNAIRGISSIPVQRLVLPYLPYSRADRRFVKGDCWGLAAFGELVNDLCFDRVTTMDVHNEEAAGRCIRNLVNIHTSNIIDSVFNDVDDSQRGYLLPDKGAARYIEGIIKGDPIFFAEKIRDAKTGKLTGFEVPSLAKISNVRSLLIVDDICDGGGTFVGIAKRLREIGWEGKLCLYVTHGIFSKGFDELSKLFDTIYTTNSFVGRGYDIEAPMNVVVLDVV